MSTVPKVMFRGTIGSTLSTLYSVPSGKYAIVTNIFVANSSNVEEQLTIKFDGVDILSNAPISPNGTLVVDLRQPIDQLDTIQGLASTTSLSVHIAGVEVT